MGLNFEVLFVILYLYVYFCLAPSYKTQLLSS